MCILHDFYIKPFMLKFLLLHPQIPAYVIYSLTCVLGVFNHYIVPHVRKEMPWLLFSEPIVKPREWDAYEVSGKTFQYIFNVLLVALLASQLVASTKTCCYIIEVCSGL